MNPSRFGWTHLAATVAPAPKARSIKLSAVQLEILRLHKTGLQPRDLATMFGLNDADVCLLLFGRDQPGKV
jgi:hypothetical protein